MSTPDETVAPRARTGSVDWHKPLLRLAIVMAALTVVLVVASFFDHRQVTGAEVWFKPIKFSISVGIYSLTLAWLIGQLGRWRRIARIAGTVATIGLAIEMVIIVGVAATGQTSHFNVSTPLHAALWAIMAVSIVVVWVMTFVVALAFFRNPFGDRARNVAVRAGVIIAIVGMGLAFLMTSPTAAQLDSFQGIAGAHTVGLADGGPGLPFLGWSTVAGDLRIPHFVGLHGLQAIPIVVLLLELIGGRWSRLADATVRLRLVWVAVAGYSMTLAVITWQALAGQSIVHPSGPILVAAIAVASGTVAAAIAALALPTGPRPQPVFA